MNNIKIILKNVFQTGGSGGAAQSNIDGGTPTSIYLNVPSIDAGTP